MLVIDIDNASESALEILTGLIDQGCEGIWGFKVRNLVRKRGAENVLGMFKDYCVMLDDKISDTADTVESLVKLYASLPHPPTWLTISGADPTGDALTRAVACKGSMELVITTVLSDASDDDCMESFSQLPFISLYHRQLKAKRSGLRAITCPGYLLPQLEGKNWPIVLATGGRSVHVSADNHKNATSYKEIFKEGATHAVVGREIINSPDPERALLGLAATCEKAKLERRSALVKHPPLT